MKRFFATLFIFCFLLLPCSSRTCFADTYVNKELGFSVTFPDDFKDRSVAKTVNLKLASNGSIIAQLRHLKTNDMLHGGSWDKVIKKEKEAYVQHHKFYNSLTSPQFGLMGFDVDKTPSGLHYLWMLFLAGTEIEGETFSTTMLKYFILQGERLVELDFISPADDMKKSAKIIEGIVNSVQFLSAPAAPQKQ